MKFIIVSILIAGISALSIPENLDASPSLSDSIVGTNDGYTFTCQASGFFGVFPGSLELEVCKKATDCEWDGRPISSHNKLWDLFAPDCIKDCRCSAVLATSTSTTTLPASSLSSSSSPSIFPITLSSLATSSLTKSPLTTFPINASSPTTSPSVSLFSTNATTSLKLSVTAPLTHLTTFTPSTLPTEISSVAL